MSVLLLKSLFLKKKKKQALKDVQDCSVQFISLFEERDDY